MMGSYHFPVDAFCLVEWGVTRRGDFRDHWSAYENVISPRRGEGSARNTYVWCRRLPWSEKSARKLDGNLEVCSGCAYTTTDNRRGFLVGVWRSKSHYEITGLILRKVIRSVVKGSPPMLGNLPEVQSGRLLRTCAQTGNQRSYDPVCSTHSAQRDNGNIVSSIGHYGCRMIAARSHSREEGRSLKELKFTKCSVAYGKPRTQ